jgi:hypothetical protein
MFPSEPLDDQTRKTGLKIRFERVELEGLVQAFRFDETVEGDIPRGSLTGGIFGDRETGEDLEEPRGLFDRSEAGDAKLRHGVHVPALGVRRFPPL